MPAFTDEQLALLQAAFNHVWARMAALHDDINEDSLRLAALLDGLHAKGLITTEQVTKIVSILDMEARERRQTVTGDELTEQAITRKILHGD